MLLTAVLLAGSIGAVLVARASDDTTTERRSIPWTLVKLDESGRTATVRYPAMTGDHVRTRLVGSRVLRTRRQLRLTLVEEVSHSGDSRSGVYFEIRRATITLPETLRGRGLLPGRVDRGLGPYQEILRARG
jgi:hypothetical protein